jgi:hypothetical protein
VALGNLGLALLKLGQAEESLKVLTVGTKLHPAERLHPLRVEYVPSGATSFAGRREE